MGREFLNSLLSKGTKPVDRLFVSLLGQFSGDGPEYVDMILHNFLANAVKYTLDGGATAVQSAPGAGSTFTPTVPSDPERERLGISSPGPGVP